MAEDGWSLWSRRAICRRVGLLGAALAASRWPPLARASGSPTFDDRVRAALAELGESELSLIVGVKRRDAPLLLREFGAPREDGILPGSTQIDLNSITKTVTGVATLKLAEQGKIGLNQVLGELFYEVPADKVGISIHQLLTHSAGFEESLGEDDEPLTRDAFLARAFAARLRSEPGQLYGYSNVGFSLLAAIIELGSGKSYDRYLREEVFRGLELPDTGYRSVYEDSRSLRTRQGATIQQASWGGPEPFWNLIGNGGLVSSAADFVAFREAVVAGRIVSPEWVALSQQKHIEEDEAGTSHYGYGLVVQDLPQVGRVYWHDGGNDVFSSVWYELADPGVLLFIAAADNPSGGATTALSVLARHLSIE
jgi:CubicO group peptidase (beta-lactamase class C family)